MPSSKPAPASAPAPPVLGDLRSPSPGGHGASQPSRGANGRGPGRSHISMRSVPGPCLEAEHDQRRPPVLVGCSSLSPGRRRKRRLGQPGGIAWRRPSSPYPGDRRGIVHRKSGPAAEAITARTMAGDSGSSSGIVLCDDSAANSVPTNWCAAEGSSTRAGDLLLAFLWGKPGLQPFFSGTRPGRGRQLDDLRATFSARQTLVHPDTCSGEARIQRLPPVGRGEVQRLPAGPVRGRRAWYRRSSPGTGKP